MGGRSENLAHPQARVNRVQGRYRCSLVHATPKRLILPLFVVMQPKYQLEDRRQCILD
jgi:hypothetical protein